jgi:xanthine dehydrogenase YagR molybdenum-binding subunit
MAVMRTAAVGAALDRVEGRDKVTGQARYSGEQPAARMTYGFAVTSTVARGEIRGFDAAATLAHPGVVAVLTHENAGRVARVDNVELAVLQSSRVAYRGQVVAVVVAESLDAAREGARLLRVDYAQEPHDVELRGGHPSLYAPEEAAEGEPADTEQGDVNAAIAAAPYVVDATYTTPALHNNPIEPHATIARWEGGSLTLYDTTQGSAETRATLAEVFELSIDRVRVICHHIGGGFGSKGTRPQSVLAALAARLVDRPVKLALTRQQLFSVVGYRSPTIQRLRLAAGADGLMTAIAHDSISQTSHIGEFVESAATVTRTMYRAPHRRTTHRLAVLDVPTPAWMRAPGEAPGSFALESAIDELAIACGLDPIELRERNEPEVDPESGRPWSSRNLLACLREGAERFGWAGRDPAPGMRREGRWLVGTGVAASTYPTFIAASRALARAEADGSFTVRLAASDMGTGARTALTQIAADALDAPPELVRMEIGDSALPRAPLAGASLGTASWGTAIVKACAALRGALEERGGGVPPEGLEVEVDTAEDVRAQEEWARQAFGAQFAEVRVDADTGEVRVPRLLGVFAAGRIVNPKTARSQFIGGMTMGLSMALHEEGVMDREFGDYLNHDLAGYHVTACADVGEIEATWVDEDDPHLNPMGTKGIGEIGVVGTAAAIANAVHHATGVRVRDLPIRLDRLLQGGAPPA